MLEISFAVKIFGFNIADALRNIAVNQNQVARKVLIVTDLYDAPHFDLVGFYIFKSIPTCLATGNAAGIAGVFLYIAVVATSVLKNIFDHRNADDKH